MSKLNPMSPNIQRRAEQLDTMADALPMNHRDLLADILTDEDIETLRHSVNEGMGENTLCALTPDLAYLEAWAYATIGPSPSPRPKPWNNLAIAPSARPPNITTTPKGEAGRHRL